MQLSECHDNPWTDQIPLRSSTNVVALRYERMYHITSFHSGGPSTSLDDNPCKVSPIDPGKGRKTEIIVAAFGMSKKAGQILAGVLRTGPSNPLDLTQ